MKIRKRALWLIPVALAVILTASLFHRKIKATLRQSMLTHMTLLSRTSYAADLIEIQWVDWLLRHYARLDIYRDADRALPPGSPSRVIFFGDSITAFWVQFYPEQFFPGKSYIGRGIGGQTTDNMIWRFHQDVVLLHPGVVVILAGANDIVRHRISEAQTEKNFQTMVQVAKRQGIQVVLCSVTPINRRNPNEQPEVDRRIASLNAWLRQFAAQQHLHYVDYYSALADTNGRLQRSFAMDGIHPNAAGYAVMRPIAQKTLDALHQP